jgi:predicted dienelactone hydrolase
MRQLAAVFALLLMVSAAHAETIRGEWTDAQRSNRIVPYKIYMPNAATPSPVVIFSHGLGGNRDGAEYLLSHLADHGYVAVAVQHAGSDTPAVFPGGVVNQSGMRNAISASGAADRFRDIPFALDELAKMNAADARLKGRLDMNRIGMSGHSYGAITTMALSGQGFGPMGRMTFDDARIKASIAYSPSKPRQGDPAQVLAGVRIPMFHMTGTNDQNPLDPSDPASDRQIPYRALTNADKYLLVFKDGDHMVFSGRGIGNASRPNDPRFHAWIQKASLAFWDTYLKSNADAKAYLTAGKFKSELGAEGTFEFQLR